MIVVMATDCQHATNTIASHALLSLESILLERKPIPSFCPTSRKDIGKDKAEDITHNQSAQHVRDEVDSPQSALSL